MAVTALTGYGALPPVLKLSQIVLVTGLSEYSIRYRLDSGALVSHQWAKHGQRYVSIVEVAELCTRLGIVPDWAVLLE